MARVPAQTLLLNVLFSKEFNLSCVNPSTFSFQIAVRVLRETIKTFNLGLMLPSHFFNDEVSKAILDTTHPLLPRSTSVHGTLRSEKDNSSQALPRSFCTKFLVWGAVRDGAGA